MGRRRLGAGAAMLGMVATAGVVAAPAAGAAPATVHTADFEQDTGGWSGRGTAQVAPSTAQARSGAQSLAVTGRTDTWHGPALDAAALLPAGSWEVEAWVRLADTTPELETDVVTMSAARTPAGGSTSYDTVAWQVAVSDSAWTRVSGTYEFGTSNSGLELYLESPDATQAFFVDDVTIAGEAAAPVEPGTRVDLATDFESGTGGWGPRGDALVSTTTADAHSGSTSLLATNRLQAWQGPALDVTDGLAVGETVQASVWAKLAPGQAPASLKVSVQRDRAGATTAYEGVSGASAVVTADEWTQLRGTYTLGAAIDTAQVYVEGDAGVDFLIDDFALTGFAETPLQDVPGLADVLGEDGFEHVGVAVDQRETVGRPAQLVQRHFDAITPENDGKPAEIQPVEGTFTFGDLDALLDFADATGTDVYGHVLVWHSQTPDWFFRDGDRPLTNSPADQALLRARMEAHIKAIADHVDARYPDGDSPIWAMDVVNEVIADGDTANPHDMRDSRWFQVLGEGFVDEAFRLADRYFPDTALFINDYNTEMPTKRVDYLDLVSSLVERGVPIDGVGHQAHVDFARPVEWLDDSLTAVEELSARTGTPLLQAITELDVSDSKENNGADVSNGTVPQHSPAMADQDAAETELGYYYRDLFDMLRGHSESIESVTFWGISNGRSWLRTWPAARPWESPLPFDDDLQVMPAYWGIVDPSQLAPRPADQLPPRIAGVDDVAADSTSPAGARVQYPLPEAGDTRDGAVTATCTPPPGTLFPIGTTEVTCTVTDAAGNTSNPSTFDVVVTPPATETELYQQINNGPVVRANAKQTVQLVVQFGNRGRGVLLGDSFEYSCTQTAGPALALDLAPGSARQVGNRDYPAGQNGNFTLRARPTQVGQATFDCTMSMTDSRGAPVSSTTTVTIDVRR
ncbi:endo-1,4-beta-xylanase [Modestobacter sp. VKM Ac-2977]|uniref:endo-1,4-beta-xylanase n=1 Tax=Modestobacter sp. VKM Ac-2977 TaxID=3004131 RepID=UPI0022AAF1AC|nr:endo-1,4-beta-xylanase [Modestobacter sp. VKM Ac-2977]MCZ2820579.1 endo-1,4-beta-xylanase [Modestobacter sp. VKM Ac-2977]